MGVVPGMLLVDRYRVLEPIGVGGMAQVFLAEDTALGRRVAVKVLRADGTDAAATERAAIETRSLASLNHHALVTLFDAHLAFEPRFLVMEHVAGRTLAARLTAGPLGLDELAALADQLADALHVVHDAGIVHRDVKPSNILLSRSRVPGVALRAKLADFGIAHLLGSDRVTSPSLIVGTAAYIAPELLHGAAPAPSSDIYALGLVLLEAATGERAFAGTEGNRGQLLARLTRDPDMPATLGRSWRQLLAAMTAREPGDRPSALEIVEAAAAAHLDPGAPDDTAHRAAHASLETAAWPITASAASGIDATAIEEITTATSTTAIVPRPAARTRREASRTRRRRALLRTGALSLAGAAAAVTAALLLTMPPATPTTGPLETPATTLETEPSVAPQPEPVSTEGGIVPAATVDEVTPAPVEQPATVSEPAPADDAPGSTGAANSGNPNAGPGNNSGNGSSGNPNAGSGSNSGNGNSGNSGNGNR
ncbi:protein kinase [Microbacterium radiodurans]|uniref:non-specific serine/threonine protein kinase n=2 Tax=Microbacterium radiodurans TaxID=661398 RepID=A0A5J5IQ39_9MICO|nr:protein kinase [Microbacterium radiodurans]